MTQPKRPTPQVPAPWSPHGNPEHPSRKLAAIGHIMQNGKIWTMRPAAEAFTDAIQQGRLSDPAQPSEPYAHRAPNVTEWMYMGTTDGIDAFKHIQTRQYLPTPEQIEARMETARRMENPNR